jgi:hypothetical protein
MIRAAGGMGRQAPPESALELGASECGGAFIFFNVVVV